ncbi:MAG: hypothetical protein WD599_00765, partial [Balneolaceae bacterium]
MEKLNTDISCIKLNLYHIVIILSALCILLLNPFFTGGDVRAQDRIPREYTNPEELISFDRQTPFQDAIQVIDRFAQEFQERFVIDRTGYTGEIGINLPAMHWEEALNYILRVQNMVLVENPDFYEILTRQQADELHQETGDRARPASQADPSDIIATTQTR